MVYYTIAVKLACHMIYYYIFGTLKDSCCIDKCTHHIIQGLSPSPHQLSLASFVDTNYKRGYESVCFLARCSVFHRSSSPWWSSGKATMQVNSVPLAGILGKRLHGDIQAPPLCNCPPPICSTWAASTHERLPGTIWIVRAGSCPVINHDQWHSMMAQARGIVHSNYQLYSSITLHNIFIYKQLLNSTILGFYIWGNWDKLDWAPH